MAPARILSCIAQNFSFLDRSTKIISGDRDISDISVEVYVKFWTPLFWISISE